MRSMPMLRLRRSWIAPIPLYWGVSQAGEHFRSFRFPKIIESGGALDFAQR